MTLDLLRFTTAGAVDDGKSTLIGRLLFDSKQVFEDQLEQVAAGERATRRRGALDLALLTDGLRAEREQGITIDVAYRYFAHRAERGASSSPTARAPAVHAQHGHRRLDGRSRGRAGRRPPRRDRAVKAPRVHQRAARDPADGRGDQQDGPRRALQAALRGARRRVRRLRRQASRAGRRRRHLVHPDLGARRRQRRRALGRDAVVRGTGAARACWRRSTSPTTTPSTDRRAFRCSG